MRSSRRQSRRARSSFPCITRRRTSSPVPCLTPTRASPPTRRPPSRSGQPSTMKIEHIFISPGHNYVGRHGMEPERHAAIEVTRAQCIAGQGIVGDRFFGHKEGYKGQITFFSTEVFRRLCNALGIPGASPRALRRNVVVSGIDLNTLIGCRFTIGETEFEGV